MVIVEKVLSHVALLEGNVKAMQVSLYNWGTIGVHIFCQSAGPHVALALGTPTYFPVAIATTHHKYALTVDHHHHAVELDTHVYHVKLYFIIFGLV